MSFSFGSRGMNRSAGQTNRVNRSGSLAIRLFIPKNQVKKHSFLIFTMFPTRTLSKILRENSHSNGLSTSFDVLSLRM